MTITYIGSTLSISAATPTTEDASGYGALTWTEIGKVKSIGELGETSEDVTVKLLKTGRVDHVNGVKDLGEIAVALDYDASDSGYAIVLSGNNTNTSHSFKITDTDSKIDYFQGVVANLKKTERDPSQSKGVAFVIRGQSGITEA